MIQEVQQNVTARGIGVLQVRTMPLNINPGIRCEGLQSFPFRGWREYHEEPHFRRNEVGNLGSAVSMRRSQTAGRAITNPSTRSNLGILNSAEMKIESKC
jgi:hypothetical protein